MNQPEQDSAFVTLDTTPLWTDLADAAQRIDALDCSDDMKAHLREFREQGYTVMKGAVSPADCDALVREFRDYCAAHPISEDFRDAHGLHDRLASFHLVSTQAPKLYLQPQLQAFLTLLFGEQAQIVGSLLFEKASEQSMHRDTPTFFTNPLNRFVGAWYALEDIGEDQGPLGYYAGSHRVADDADLRKLHSKSAPYQLAINQHCNEQNCKLVRFYPSKGDMLVWHPQLVHGGMRRNDQTASRLSIVFHWKSSRSSIHPPKDFFSGADRFAASHTLYRELDGGIEAIDQGRPNFFKNRKEGNFDRFE